LVVPTEDVLKKACRDKIVRKMREKKKKRRKEEKIR
jgi:hypothetical protein